MDFLMVKLEIGCVWLNIYWAKLVIWVFIKELFFQKKVVL